MNEGIGAELLKQWSHFRKTCVMETVLFRCFVLYGPCIILRKSTLKVWLMHSTINNIFRVG